MSSRRGFIGAAGAGLASGLAGCQGVLDSSDSESSPTENGSESDPDGESGSGPLLRAFVGEPRFDSFEADPFGELESIGNEVASVDAASLREHDEYVQEGLATTGTLSQSTTAEAAATVDSVDRTVYVRTDAFDTSDAWMEGWSGYVAGDVDAAAYEPVDGTDPSQTSDDGYDHYEYGEEPIVALGETDLVCASVRFVPGDDSDDGGEFPADPAIASYRLDQLDARPAPPDWIGDTLDALRPYDVLSLEHTFAAGEDTQVIDGEAHVVHGEETTFRVVTATRTAEQFEAGWDRAYVEQTIDSEVGDVEAEFDVGETLGTAEVTVPTGDTSIGASE